MFSLIQMLEKLHSLSKSDLLNLPVNFKCRNLAELSRDRKAKANYSRMIVTRWQKA